jgi:hypothetical protein
MANYTSYTTDFRDAASDTSMFALKSGLCFTMRNTLSAIPASLGHVIDTMFGMDGLWTKDKKNHFGGPFGLLLGIVPFIGGAIVGMVLQIVLNLPAYAAYYILDKPFSFLITGFDKIMQGQTRSMTVNRIFDALNRFYVRLTQGTPTQMSGFFGFLAGLGPQTLTYLVIRLGATVSSLSRFISDKTCSGIHVVYRKIGQAISRKKDTDEEAPKVEQAVPVQENKKPRIKRPAGKEQDLNQEQDQELANAKTNKLDLFAILGTTYEDYKNGKANISKLFKMKSLQCHPDKFPPDRFPEGQPADMKVQWDNLTAAKAILSDKNRAALYIKWYEVHMQKASAARSPSTLFGQNPEPRVDADMPAQASAPAPAGNPVIGGERKRKVIGRRH